MEQYDRRETLYKEIDLIQTSINRMSQNSFAVKGWTIALLGVVMALLPEKFDLHFLCIVSFALILCLWYLDAFFLKTEILYRWKYNWVVKNRMNSDRFIFDLDPHNSKTWERTLDDESTNNVIKKEPSIFNIMVTPTLVPLYGILILMTGIISLIDYFM